MKKKSIILLIGALLGLAYTVYLVVHFGSSMASDDATEAISGALATALITPHMILVAIATIFAILGFFINKPWAALTAGILYSVGGVLFFMYFLFVVPSLVLSFVAYAKMKKARAVELGEKKVA